MQVLSKTRPLRVLIAFKRYQVQSLNHQLADLLELHADSAARARTAQAALKKGPEGGGCSGSGDSQDGQLDEVRSEQVLYFILPDRLTPTTMTYGTGP